jgi:hypothetical protein
MVEKEKIVLATPSGKSTAEKDHSAKNAEYGGGTLVADERHESPDLKTLAKPENEIFRVQSIFDLQRSHGNFFVQKAIADYKKDTAVPPKKVPDPGSAPAATGSGAPSLATAGGKTTSGSPPATAAALLAATDTPPAKKPVDAGQVPPPVHLPVIASKPAGTPTTSAGTAPSGGGGTATLAHWKSGIHVATRQLKTDKISAAPQIAGLQQSGAAAAGKHKAEALKLPKDAKAAVSKPPKVDASVPVIPPKVDPVPEATKAVEDASNKALNTQTMPALEESPQHNMPQVGPAPPPAPESRADDDKAKAPDADKKLVADAGAKDPKKEQADKVNAPPQQQPEGAIHKGPGGEIVLEGEKGTTPKPEPELPKVFKSGIAAALARLMVDPKSEADSILTQVRNNAYNGELPHQFPDIGKRSLDDLTSSLRAELDGIRKEAGISEQEIKSAVDKRQQEIEKEKAEALGQVVSAGDAEKQKLAQAGTDTLSIIAGTREEIDKATEEKLAQTKGDNDPEVVKLKRERLIHESQKRVAQQVVFYEGAGKKRHQEVNQIANLQRISYRNTVKQDLQKIEQLAGGEAGSKVWPWVIYGANSRNWGDAQQRKIEQLLVDKGKETDGFVLDLQNGVHAAGRQANEMIRTWADGRLHEHRSFWAQMWQMFNDWATQAKAESQAWQDSRNKATRDAMVDDMNFLGGVVMTAGAELSDDAKKNLDKLSAEQRAIITTYYGVDAKGNPVANPKDPRNPIAAIAAGMRVRILDERGPKILEEFEEYFKTIGDTDWKKLDALGQAENPGSHSAAWVCSEIHEALHGGLFGWNDEPRVFSALAGLTKVQLLAAHKLYQLEKPEGYGKNLDEDIHSEMGGTFGQHKAERDRAEALLAGDPILADVATLREAMKGGITGWGTDEKAIMDALRGKSAAERDRIKQLYFEKYGEKLDDDLKDELTGTFEDEHDYARVQALMEGDSNKADAIAIDQAMYGGFTSTAGFTAVAQGAGIYAEPGWGTDRKAIEDVYEQVRKDTEKELQNERRRDPNKPPLTTKDLEAEVKRRYEQVEASYNATYKDKWGEGNESALRRAYKDELSDGELSLVNAIADNDLTKADAARIQVEKESTFYADDDIINGVLKHQYERALEELKRDKGPQLQADLERRRQEAADKHQPWDAYRMKLEQHKLDQQLEKEAKTKGKEYMSKLEDTYDTDFGSIGKGSLGQVIEKNMSGYEREEARKRVAQGGWLTPAQEIHFATEGLGTKEGMLSKALEGKSAKDFEDIEKEWATLHPGESLKQRIDSETSGRLNFELNQKLKGEPMTMKEEMDRMDEMVQHEREEHTGAWKTVASDEENRLEFRYKEMKEKYDAANAANLTDEQRAQKVAEFQRFAGYTSVSVQEHKESMESITDSLVKAVTTAIALIVSAVVIFFSAGTATPAVVAALSTWWGAAAVAMGTALVGVGIKEAMLRGDYGVEDMGVDLAVGGVDALTAAATAGLSKAVMSSAAERFAESMAKTGTRAEREALKRSIMEALKDNPELAKRGFLGTLAQSESRAARMFGHGVSGAMFGAAGSIPSGAARSVLDSKTWEGGGAWEKILKGATAGIPEAAAGGGVLGMIGGVRSPHGPGKLPATRETTARPLTEHDLVPPGHATTETLREGLPPDLQKKIPIHVDPELESNTVRVHYDVDENGVFKDIHIRAGPSATPHDIELHVKTVRTMQKYTGLQGRVRLLIAKARAWVSRSGALPTRRFMEAQLEVEKLPAHIKEKMAQLADPELDPKMRAELEADVEHLQDQFDQHKSVLEGTMPEEEARGYVAAEGRKKVKTRVTEAEETAAPEKKKSPPTAEEASGKPPVVEKELVQGLTEVEDTSGAGAKTQSKTAVKKELRGLRRRIQELEAEHEDLQAKLREEGDLPVEELHRLRDAEYEIGLLRGQEKRLAATVGQQPLTPEQLAKQRAMVDEYLAANPDKRFALRGMSEDSAIVSELEDILGREPDPIDRMLAAIRGTERDKTFKDSMLPVYKKLMPKDSIFSTQDWRQFKVVLGLKKLPWEGAKGIDLFLVDPDTHRIRPIDLTGQPNPAHLASKQAQADALQKLLPDWTVEPAVDIYHGKGFTDAKIFAQIRPYLDSYGLTRP